MGGWRIIQFNSVFDEFYGECEPDLQEAIDECLDFFREHGNLTRMPYSRPLGDGIFEFRPGTNTVEARLLYFYHSAIGRAVIIAVAFKKKTRATRPKAIRQAKQIKRLVEATPELGNELSVYS